MGTNLGIKIYVTDDKKKNMKNKSKSKIFTAILGSIICVLCCTLAVAFIILQIRTNSISDDYSLIYKNEKYKTPVYIDNIDVIKQKVSCGYAVIEMCSAWAGQNVTEDSLYNEYGKVVTSTGKSFCNEMNKKFPDYNIKMHKYLNNTELIDTVYESLSSGAPVPFEWAAQYENEWTLHYSLIIGMDITNDTVKIANPYGYYEEISINEFLERTSFEAFSDMPFFFRLAFAFGIFEKNTIFTIDDCNRCSINSNTCIRNCCGDYVLNWVHGRISGNWHTI